MNDLLRQIRNERRANLWLGVELLVVFAVMWYLVDWTYVTVRTWLQPMGFDTEHCYELTFNRLTPQAEGYQPGDDAEADMRNLLEIVERLRHRPGVEYVAVSQNSIPYIDGANGFNLTIDSVRVSAMLRWGQPDYFRMFRIQGVAVLAEDGRKVLTTSSDSLADALHRSDRNVIISRNFVSTERYTDLGYADALPLLGYEGGERADGTYSFKVVGICEPMRWSHFSTTYQWGGPVGAYELLDSDIINLGNPLYVQVSLRLKPEADTGADFVEALMDDADRLYALGNVFLLDVQPFTALQRRHRLPDAEHLPGRHRHLLVPHAAPPLGDSPAHGFRQHPPRGVPPADGRGPASADPFRRARRPHRLQRGPGRAGGRGADAVQCRPLPVGPCDDVGADGVDGGAGHLVSCPPRDADTAGRGVA